MLPGLPTTRNIPAASGAPPEKSRNGAGEMFWEVNRGRALILPGAQGLVFYGTCHPLARLWGGGTRFVVRWIRRRVRCTRSRRPPHVFLIRAILAPDRRPERI
jgi:hypothetical protein